MTKEDVPPHRVNSKLAVSTLWELQGFPIAAHLLDGDGQGAAGSLIGFRRLLHLEKEFSECDEARSGKRRLRPICLLPCGVRPQYKLFGFAVAPEALVDLSELAEGDKGMHG